MNPITTIIFSSVIVVIIFAYFVILLFKRLDVLSKQLEIALIFLISSIMTAWIYGILLGISVTVNKDLQPIFILTGILSISLFIVGARKLIDVLAPLRIKKKS